MSLTDPQRRALEAVRADCVRWSRHELRYWAKFPNDQMRSDLFGRLVDRGLARVDGPVPELRTSSTVVLTDAGRKALA